MLGLNKIIGLLPLVSIEEYKQRFKNEQAISFLQIENSVMCCPLTHLSWDSIIDLLLNVNQQQFIETIKEKQANNVDFNTERQYEEYLDSNSCKMSGVSPFDNSSQMSKDNLILKSKFENLHKKIGMKPKTAQHTNMNSLNSSPQPHQKHNMETFGQHTINIDGESPMRKSYLKYSIPLPPEIITTDGFKGKNNRASEGKLSDIDDCDDSESSDDGQPMQTTEEQYLDL